VNGPRKFLLIVASILTFTPLMFSSTYYISDSGGSVNCGADGTQTTQAYSFSGYSVGDTLKLCGTITHSLTAQQNSISYVFESNASLQIPNCGNGCIELNGKSGGLIDGGTPCGPGTPCNAGFGDYGLGAIGGTGSIRQMTNGTLPAAISNITCSSGVATVTGPTAFGYSLPNEPPLTITGNSVSAYNGTWTVTSDNDGANQFTFAVPACSGTGNGGKVGVLCPSGSYCSSQNGTNMIDGQSSGGNGWEIRNLLIGSYYVRVSILDKPPLSEAQSIYLAGCSGCATLIHDNTLANAGLAYIPTSSGDTGLQIYNNALLGGGDSMVIAGSNSSNNLSGAQIHDNYVADNGVWDTVGCAYHLDGIHIWGLNGATMSNVNFYNNWLAGNFGGCQTGAVFFEGNNQNYKIYNNIFTTTYKQNNNGIIDINGPGPFLVANNTIIGNNVSDVCFGVGSPAGSPTITFENNIVGNCSTNFLLQNSPTLLSWDYNAYEGGGWADPGPPWYGTLAQWQAACKCDTHGQFYSTESALQLNSDGIPQSGSPVINLGADLSGLNIASLNMDTSAGDTQTPVQRISPWTIGASNAGGGNPPPAPPTGLSAQVQ